jgi:hypothetical protein
MENGMNNRLITKFSNGSYLEYAKGRFDNWCIYSVSDHARHAIKDLEVFNQIINCTKSVDSKNLYGDFIDIYSKTTADFNPTVIKQIKNISLKYSGCRGDIEYILSFLYAGMVAEENKYRAILKKRIKRLALHQLLIEGVPAFITANYSRGKNWKLLDQECKQRGF